MLIASFALVNGQFQIDAYDCDQASYVYNLTKRLHSIDTKDDLFFVDQELQIIQNVADTDRVCGYV